MSSSSASGTTVAARIDRLRGIVPPSKGLDPGWPKPLDPKAFHGLLGEIVRVMEPASEADPAALLVQCLVALGNVVGPKPHWTVENTRHGLNLFVTLVGPTSKARKGTSWNRVSKLVSTLDPGWFDFRIQSGLSSGEGFIWAVRDASEEDEGVSDKRLLLIEPEFASTLRVLGRDGNTLSAMMRQAWDDGRLRTLTKNKPAVATNAHISVIGHITRDELKRYLTQTEMANGFGNRFLWICVRRSKCLPEGGTIDEARLDELAERLKPVFEFASRVGEMRRDAVAAGKWAHVYEQLSEGTGGMFGAMTSRAEAQVMRLACLYALVDCSDVIRGEHLDAALALWEYAEDSARHIFGEALGDPEADRLLAALQQAGAAGLTRTEVRDLFGRNFKAEIIEHKLHLLSDLGKARMALEPTSGRSVERWVYVNGRH